MKPTPPQLDLVLKSAGPWLESCYPEEGCGLLVADGECHRFIACENLADTPEVRFEIDPLEFIRAEDRGEQVVGIVHSHPDGDASLSARDVARMTFEHGGRRVPAFPGLWHVVVGVVAGQCVAARAYQIIVGGEVRPADSWL